jgi:hypothetical protein
MARKNKKKFYIYKKIFFLKKKIKLRKILTLGFLLTYNAPIPLGPYTLWLLIDIKSIFKSFTSMGIFPIAWAASVWKKTLLDLQIFPIYFIS